MCREREFIAILITRCLFCVASCASCLMSCLKTLLYLLLSLLFRDECCFATWSRLTMALSLLIERVSCRLHSMLVHSCGCSTVHWFAGLLSHIWNLGVVTHLNFLLSIKRTQLNDVIKEAKGGFLHLKKDADNKFCVSDRENTTHTDISVLMIT